MQIELLGALDYAKLKKELNNKNVDKPDEIIECLKELEKYERVKKVSSAGRLSRFAGDVFEVIGMSGSKTFEQNVNFAKKVISMGHDSITDHDYLVFAIKNVSPVIEQTIIEERFSSFTIKSRREVDFSKVGFYIPDFRDKNGKILSNNDSIKDEYETYMNTLFKEYSIFVEKGIPKEDARFVLPYSYYSNIIMGVDAHTLKDMIIKYTKGKLSNISELRQFGERLYEIAKEIVPYITTLIDEAKVNRYDAVEEYLRPLIKTPNYKILDRPYLINCTKDVDNTILISALMRIYQINYDEAKRLLIKLSNEHNNFKEKLMRKIVFESEGIELKQVNFEYQIPLSFAVLTHLTRHRTHPILVPDFVPNVDLLQYKIPPKIQNYGLQKDLDNIFSKNYEVYMHFLKDYNICEEDLVYFTLSGNMVNVVTNLDGKTLAHILGLRECNKAQWETREMAYGMHNELKNKEDASIFESLLGATCTTQGFCKEGKESCGKIKTLKNKNF